MSEGQMVLRIRNLQHELVDHRSGERFTLKIDELEARRGEFVAIAGPTGCGKSTLMLDIGLLRKPTRADEFVIVEHREGDRGATEHDVMELWRRGRERVISGVRRRVVGHAFQRPELIPALTVSENVAVPLALNHATRVRDRVELLLEGCGRLDGEGVSDLIRVASNRVHLISGGQAQRVGLARSVAHGPMLLLADEPTSNLDRRTACRVLQFLDSMREAEGMTIVMVSHDESLVGEFASRLIRMDSTEDNVGHTVGEEVLRPDERLEPANLG